MIESVLGSYFFCYFYYTGKCWPHTICSKVKHPWEKYHFQHLKLSDLAALFCSKWPHKNVVKKRETKI